VITTDRATAVAVAIEGAAAVRIETMPVSAEPPDPARAGTRSTLRRPLGEQLLIGHRRELLVDLGEFLLPVAIAHDTKRKVFTNS
jgi:hypothetical protein